MDIVLTHSYWLVALLLLLVTGMVVTDREKPIRVRTRQRKPSRRD